MPGYSDTDCGWDLIAYENAGSMQGLRFLGDYSESSNGAYGNDGSVSYDYDEVLIVAGDFNY